MPRERGVKRDVDGSPARTSRSGLDERGEPGVGGIGERRSSGDRRTPPPPVARGQVFSRGSGLVVHDVFCPPRPLRPAYTVVSCPSSPSAAYPSGRIVECTPRDGPNRTGCVAVCVSCIRASFGFAFRRCYGDTDELGDRAGKRARSGQGRRAVFF